MDKQKKIILQVVIPVAIIFLSIIFFLIFKFIFPDSEKKDSNNEINIEFPDVKTNIESNKIKAYEVQESYERQSQNKDSDLLLEYNVPAPTDTIKPAEKKVKRSISTKSKPTSRKKNSNLQNRLNIQAKMAENEYQEFSKTSDNTPPTPAQQPIVTIPSDIVFNSMSTKKQHTSLSSKEIYGYIHNEQTVINRSLVKIRTAEPFIIGNYTIPANTLLYGMCSFSNDRVLINIRSVPWQNRAIACNINVYDPEGFEGISIYDRPETEAHRKSGASTSRRIGSALGTAVKSVTGTTLAGELSGTLAEGVIKGASAGTSNRINLNKAVLRNNHKIILKIN